MSGRAAASSDPVALSEWVAASREARARGVARCMEAIASRDGEIRAWVRVAPQPNTASGPLAGVPFGAKDIIEARGLPVEYGSPVYRGRIGVEDADIVTELKSRGAILLGKTQTAAFAYITPPPTRNPRRLDHTPGGSSSGSAAAVAAGMVPFALGTQTKGSVLRPASYCGVTGFKPSFSLFSMKGILPVAPSLDTLGFFTYTPADMRVLWTALGRDAGGETPGVVAALDPPPPAEPEMTTAFQAALSLLRLRGVIIRSVDLAGMLGELSAAAHVVMCYEAARVHRERFNEHGDALGDLADLVRAGSRTTDDHYHDARRRIDEWRKKIAELYTATPVILAPAATGPAPAGLASTGDPAMNAPWTALGTPAISIPMPTGDRLPLGLQLTAAHGQDGLLLNAAVRLFDALSGAD